MAEKRLKVGKIGTHDNPADMMTKSVSHEIMLKHSEAMDLHVDSSRAATAPELKCIVFRPRFCNSAERGCKNMIAH